MIFAVLDRRLIQHQIKWLQFLYIIFLYMQSINKWWYDKTAKHKRIPVLLPLMMEH